jgi:protein ImuB
LTSRRFLSLWLPRLTTDRARRAHEVDPCTPLAVVATVKTARRLVGVDVNAARLGLGVGLTLADAQARQPSLVVCDAEPEAEARLLTRVADACARFTPLVALDGRDGLMLDVSGVAHLFGGEDGLVAEVEARLSRSGLTVAPGLADSPRAAWALARFSHRRVAPAGLAGKDFARLYHDMPAAALGLDAEICADLARAGLRRIGDLAMRPRAPIAARFGADVIARLDALAGEQRGAISPRFSAPDLSLERRFASPIATSEAAFVALARLADDLAALLEQHGKGARRLELMLFRVDGGVRRIAVGAGRPLAEAKAMARLFAERLAGGAEEEIDTGFGIDLIRLSCLVAESIAPAQGEWERLEESAGARALADLVDRLSARLGTRRVTRLELVSAHLPEQAFAAAPAALGEARQGNRHGEEQSDETRDAPARPLRLFERPEPIEALAEVPDGPPLRFRWRRVLHEVAAIEGPERIAAPWWRRPGAPTRDYFRAEDALGRRFWLYREGLYGRETTQAKWFVHGVFG